MEKWWKPEFKTKKELQEAIRKIANEAYLGEALPQDQEEFMLYVLSHHVGFEEKCGAGYSHIFVDLDEFKSRHFRIARVDGSDIDISWHQALTPRPSKRNDFLSALREEVKDQIFLFKMKSDDVCAICRQGIESGEKHIDHLVPFRDLVKDFFQDATHKVKDLGTTYVLEDRDMAERWKAYHQENAILQSSHAKCNLKKG